MRVLPEAEREGHSERHAEHSTLFPPVCGLMPPNAEPQTAAATNRARAARVPKRLTAAGDVMPSAPAKAYLPGAPALGSGRSELKASMAFRQEPSGRRFQISRNLPESTMAATPVGVTVNV